MNDVIATILVGIGIVVGFIALVVLETVIRGLVLVKLWAWFITPTFGLPLLTVPVALGVALIAGFLTNSNTQYKDHETDWGANVVAAILGPLLALFFGWIYTLFM